MALRIQIIALFTLTLTHFTLHAEDVIHPNAAGAQQMAACAAAAVRASGTDAELGHD